MFYSCPHCRELVATDRETRQPPTLCPRCGGVLRQPEIEDAAPPEPVGKAPSFASFLRGGDPDHSVPATSDAVQPSGTVANEAAIAQAPGHPTSVPAEAEESSDSADPPEATPDEQVEAGEVVEAIGVVESFERGSPLPAPRPPAAAPLPHDPAPSFMRPSSRPGPPRAARWQWAAVFVLAIVLIAQVLVADRARLAADAGWRPLVLTLCGVLGCSVPPWHQPGAISMLSRDVRPLAGRSGALDVRATFRNDARWAQPWPVLLLSLSDADGRVLGSRAFLPGEYLGPDAAQTQLAPGQSARIALKLREPHPGVVAFSFDFR